MAKITSKTGGGKPVIRQTRGPGMNLGLKKPRKNKFPKADDGPGKKTGGSSKAELPRDVKMEYLPGSGFPTAGRRKK